MVIFISQNLEVGCWLSIIGCLKFSPSLLGNGKSKPILRLHCLILIMVHDFFYSIFLLRGLIFILHILFLDFSSVLIDFVRFGRFWFISPFSVSVDVDGMSASLTPHWMIGKTAMHEFQHTWWRLALKTLEYLHAPLSSSTEVDPEKTDIGQFWRYRSQ